MAGMVQGSEEVKGSSPYQQFDFKEIGDSITFLMVGTATRNSTEWGEFTVAEVVQFDAGAKSIEEAAASAKLSSFALSVVLLNQVQNGMIVPGECYTVEFVLDKGDKYVDKKTGKEAKSKAKHYKVLRLNVPTEGIDALRTLIPNNMVKGSQPVHEPTPAEEAAPTVSKPRV